MNARTGALGLASAVTTFLLAGGATAAALSGGFGESPGVGIAGVIVGAVAGSAVGAVVVVAVAGGRLAGDGVAALAAYGAFGVAFLAVAGLRYANVPGADEVLSFPVRIGIGLAAAAAVGVLAGRTRSPDGRATDRTE